MHRIHPWVDAHVCFQIHRNQTVKKSLFISILIQIFFEFRSYCDSLRQKS